MLLKYLILILEDLQGEDEPITGLTTPPPTYFHLHFSRYLTATPWSVHKKLMKDMTSIYDPNLTPDFFLKIVLDSYPRS